MLVVEHVGSQVLIEDGGRPGHGHLGVPPSGAADRTSWALANYLVGNTNAAAAFEILLGGVRLRWTGPHALWIAVTGAPAPFTVNDIAQPHDSAVLVHPGDVIALGTPAHGLRSYLAGRGGLIAPATLGSAATDVLSGLGPPPVAAGDRIAVGPAHSLPPNTPGRSLDITAPCVVEITPGPRLDWFAAEALEQLTSTPWTVDADSNRIATRLLGRSLPRLRTGELPSEALLRGAIQIPPNGQPVVFGSDHPTTGGYPVIAVATPTSVDRLAQSRPGTPVTFRLTAGRENFA